MQSIVFYLAVIALAILVPWFIYCLYCYEMGIAYEDAPHSRLLKRWRGSLRESEE